VQMNNKPHETLVTVACEPRFVERFTEFVLRETTATGLRQRLDNRLKAQRASIVATWFINGKETETTNPTAGISLEYETAGALPAKKDTSIHKRAHWLDKPTILATNRP